MTIIFLFCLISIPCEMFSQLNNNNEDVYYHMYNKATGKTNRGDTVFQDFSSYYVVVNITDIKTTKTKKLCVLYPYLAKAIEIDNNKSIIDEKKLDFKLYSDSALKAVGFFSFDSIEMKRCIGKITVKKMEKIWEKDKIMFFKKYSGKCQLYFAYLLFENGIMSKQGCLNGELIMENTKH